MPKVPCSFRQFIRPFSDTLRATGFFSDVAGHEILNIRFGPESFPVEILFKGDSFSLLPLGEHFTSCIPRSNSELRKSLELHYKLRVQPLYDDRSQLYNLSRTEN